MIQQSSSCIVAKLTVWCLSYFLGDASSYQSGMKVGFVEYHPFLPFQQCFHPLVFLNNNKNVYRLRFCRLRKVLIIALVAVTFVIHVPTRDRLAVEPKQLVNLVGTLHDINITIALFVSTKHRYCVILFQPEYNSVRQQLALLHNRNISRLNSKTFSNRRNSHTKF